MNYIKKRAQIVYGFSLATLFTLIIFFVIIFITANKGDTWQDSVDILTEWLVYGGMYVIAYTFSFIASAIILATDWKSEALQSSKYGYGIFGITILTLFGFGWITSLVFSSKAKRIASNRGNTSKRAKREAIDPTTFDPIPTNPAFDDDMYL